MSDILQKILAVKREEFAAAQAAKPLTALRAEAEAQPPPPDFADAIRAKVSLGKTALIAEIKRASPSKGVIRADFRPGEIAASYAGLGWYVDEFQGTKTVWHQGWWNYFHLYVKFLDPDYSLIVLTNSATLGQFTSSEDVSVMRYPVVLAFYKLFIMDRDPGDMVDWEADDSVIASQLQASQAAGVGEIARQEIHDRILGCSSPQKAHFCWKSSRYLYPILYFHGIAGF